MLSFFGQFCCIFYFVLVHCMQDMPHILTKIYVKPTENGAREEKVINKKQYCKQWPVYSFILMT